MKIGVAGYLIEISTHRKQSTFWILLNRQLIEIRFEEVNFVWPGQLFYSEICRRDLDLPSHHSQLINSGATKSNPKLEARAFESLSGLRKFPKEGKFPSKGLEIEMKLAPNGLRALSMSFTYDLGSVGI